MWSAWPEPRFRANDRVDPRRFIGQPMVLRHTWRFKPHDYVAMIAGYSAARIMHQTLADQRLVWSWGLTGFYLPPELKPTSGLSDTLEDAKRDTRRSFDKWLELVLEQGGMAHWYDADPRIDPPYADPVDSETGTWWVDPSSGIFVMCNLYSMVKPRDYVRGLVGALRDLNNNQPPLPGIFPDYEAPIVRLENGERILTNARWGLPSPSFSLQGRKTDPGITNVRNTASPHWRRWLGPANRCLVPVTSFSEPETLRDGSKTIAWFALDESRPLAFFAGIHVPQWTSVRKLKEGEMTLDLFAFLTTDPNKEVEEIHPKAMPVILTNPAEWDAWLKEEWPSAALLQRPLPDHSLRIVARGEKKDGA